MSRINRTQKYAALWSYSQGWTVTKIASELELTDNQIKNAVKDSQRTTNDGIKTKSSVVSKNPNSKNLMITETQSGKKHVAIMTKAASEMNDENSKKDKQNTKNKSLPYIYNPLTNNE